MQKKNLTSLHINIHWQAKKYVYIYVYIFTNLDLDTQAHSKRNQLKHK